jgi:hypothetical protein
MKRRIGSLELPLNASNRWKSFEGSIMDIELPLDFKEFLKLLNENGVRYLLIGGYAVGYHGYPRATNDMDVWIAIHPDNAQRVEFEDCYASRIVDDFDGVTTNIIDLPHLKINKKAAGRLKDLADLENLP